MNQKLITEFSKYVNQIQFDIDHELNKKKKLGHSFRLQAIKKTLELIKKFPEEIKSSKQLEGVKGIGKRSLEHIDDVLNFGKIGKVMDDIMDHTYLSYVNQLDEIYGIGQAKAIELYKDHGVKSIEQLKELVASGKIELPQNVLLGLKYYDIAKEKIPRSEMEKHDVYLHNVLLKLDVNLFGILCGSYRRQKETSNDIDILIIHQNLITEEQVANSKINYLNKFVVQLKKNKYIVDSLTRDDVPTKYMGLCNLVDKNNNLIRRIDIRFVPCESYYAATLYFTGSADFARKIRRVANSLNYKLNEYGLYDENKKMFKVNSEGDIFDLLGMEYVSPELRI